MCCAQSEVHVRVNTVLQMTLMASGPVDCPSFTLDVQDNSTDLSVYTAWSYPDTIGVSEDVPMSNPLCLSISVNRGYPDTIGLSEDVLMRNPLCLSIRVNRGYQDSIVLS